MRITAPVRGVIQVWNLWTQFGLWQQTVFIRLYYIIINKILYYASSRRDKTYEIGCRVVVSILGRT